MSATKSLGACIKLIIAVILIPSFASGQSFKDRKKDGLELLRSGNYSESVEILEDLYKKQPSDPELSYALAKAYLESNNTGESIAIIDMVLPNNKKFEADLLLLKAKNKHLQHDFDSAIRFYKAALSKKTFDKNTSSAIKDQILRCATGLRLSKSIDKSIIDNLGEQVNSQYDEFAPLLSPNYSSKLYFASANNKSNGGKRNDQGLNDKFGNYCSDIYTTYLSNGTWTNTEPISYMINGPRNEYICGFTRKGRDMYIYRGFTLFSGEILVDTFQKNIDQMISPRYFDGPLEPEKGDKDLCFVNDSVVLFSSNRPGGQGGFDLYISKRNENGWTMPLNMGNEINSAYDEVTPFLKADGTELYFSNNGLNSIGGFDIFKSKFDAKSNKWTKPINQGLPLNSAGDDMYFSISNEGYYGYFASSRIESYGKRDIFSVYYSAPFSETNPLGVADVSTIIPPDVDLKQNAKTRNTEPDNLELTPILGAEGSNSLEVLPLFYEDEYNLLTEKNMKLLDGYSNALIENSVLNLVLSCHSATKDNPKIEAYLSLKRAEQIKDYLLKKGVNPEQILIRGIGNNFPLIKANVPIKAKSLEKSLSNRIDLWFVHAAESEMKFLYQEPDISKALLNERYSIYQKSNRGLNYRVQISASSNMNSSVILDEFVDFVVEKRPQNDLLYYLTGTSETYSGIVELRNIIQNKGIKDAFIVPYVDGWPISKAQAYQLKTQYPDLNDFITRGK